LGIEGVNLKMPSAESIGTSSEASKRCETMKSLLEGVFYSLLWDKEKRSVEE
jgi:hypothetical protein